jgi:hypothetical protein
MTIRKADNQIETWRKALELHRQTPPDDLRRSGFTDTGK